MGQSLRETARHTVEIAEAGGYTHPEAGAVTLVGLADAVAGTLLYEPDDEVTPVGTPNPRPQFEVTHESTLQAASRAGEGAACLVFASAKNPGGGFLGGAKAQEESLARASALYACQRNAPRFYGFHRKQRDLRYSDRVIYSPGVPVFRDDKGTLLARPYRTSFLTAAAPNLGAILNNQPEHAASVPEVLRRRAVRVLQVAAAHGHRTLILGAWGCGVFRNDPVIVADAFAHALATVDRFDNVVFAIYDKLPGTPAYHAFAARFTPPGGLTPVAGG